MMRRRARFAAAGTVVAALCLLAARATPAQTAPTAPASQDASTTGRELFRQGRALLEAKDYDGAAAKFEESFRLDPGGGTKLNLGLAYELAGKSASAWAAYNDALRMAKLDRRADRLKEATDHIQSLEPRLSRLRVVVPGGAQAPGLEVHRDGVALGEASWNVEIPVDPGQHRIDVVAPRKLPWTARVAVGGGGDRESVTVPPLEDAPDPAREAADRRSMFRVVGLTVAGVGLATAAAGGILGAHAIALRDRSNGACSSLGGSTLCSGEGLTQRSQAGTAADWSTALVVGGGAVAAAGIVGYLILGRGHATEVTASLAPTVGRDGGGLSLAGSW